MLLTPNTEYIGTGKVSNAIFGLLKIWVLN